MLALEITGQFKRDYKREKAGQHTDLDEVFKTVTGLLVNKKPLPIANKDHPLRGGVEGLPGLPLETRSGHDLPQEQGGH